MTARIKFQDVVNLFESKGFFVLTQSKEYVNSESKICFKDSFGYKYIFSYHVFKNRVERGGSPTKFSKENIFSVENISNWLSIHNNKIVLLVGEYINTHNKSMLLKCMVCGNEWFSSPQAITHNRGCFKCKYKKDGEKYRKVLTTPENNLAKMFPDLLLDWDYEKNSVFPNEVCSKSNYRASWVCHACGYCWDTVIGNRTSSGSGCPRCSKNNLKFGKSFGEMKIENFLIKHNVLFTREFRYSDCKNKKPLPFDFRVGKTLIEFHGEQHYRSVDRWGGKKGFEYRKKNDKIKKKYCEENGIKLIIIPYWDFDNIEEILKEKL